MLIATIRMFAYRLDFAVILLGFVLVQGVFGASHYRQMYVFGDSYSDTGAGYLDGNGPTAVAYLATKLDIALLTPQAQTGPRNSLNFAVSGAQTGSGEGKHIGSALLGFGMKNQVEQFTKLVKEKRIKFSATKTLFVLAGGLNDGNLQTETTVANLKGEIRDLYALGGRHFLVALMPEAIPGFADVGKRLNPALSLIPTQVNKELSGAQVSLSHWGLFFDQILKDPAAYGMVDTTHQCAGRAIFHQDETPCASPGTYFFYHAEHPSTAAHKMVGDKMAAELFGH